MPNPQLKLRLPPELKSQLEKAATANNRTMNTELVERLKASFDEEGKGPAAAPVFESLEWLRAMKQKVVDAEVPRNSKALKAACREILDKANVSEGILRLASQAEWLVSIFEEEDNPAEKERVLGHAWTTANILKSGIDHRMAQAKLHYAQQINQLLDKIGRQEFAKEGKG